MWPVPSVATRFCMEGRAHGVCTFPSSLCLLVSACYFTAPRCSSSSARNVLLQSDTATCSRPRAPRCTPALIFLSLGFTYKTHSSPPTPSRLPSRGDDVHGEHALRKSDDLREVQRRPDDVAQGIDKRPIDHLLFPCHHAVVSPQLH